MTRNLFSGMLPMRGSTPLAALALAAALATSSVPAAAQADILLQARSGTPIGDRFRVDSAGGLLSLGRLGTGVIPASGAGERMMWHPFKAAFRAGSTGTQWDDVNVGFYSWAGGSLTTASANFSFAMGSSSTASGQAAVALGTTALASAAGAVAVGTNVTANANYALALGRYASANGQIGSFTWGDASTATALSNSAANSFQIRASGGVILYTNSALTAGMSMTAGGSSWNVVSDRNRKHDFAAVDGEDVLARIRSVPVNTWRYHAEPGVRHIGPMAQDWHAAFGFSPDQTTINMSDLDGVNLAAVQALERRTADLQTQVADRDARIESLEARVARLEALLLAAQPEQK
jgi:trimeric autotransporter adhesin